jgi:glycosyltransferase involved in cell wall biosynthesis
VIRVLYIDPLPGFGGAQKSLLMLLDHGSTFGIQPAAVIVPQDGPIVEHVRKRGVPLGIVPFYGLRARNPLRYFETLYRLWRWAHRTKAEIIHLNFPYLLDYAFWLKKLTGCPLVCHIHTMESPTSMTAHRLAWLRRADAVVAVSRAVERSLFAWGLTPEKVWLIYNAIDLRPFHTCERRGSLRRQIGIPDGDLLVGTVCRVVPGKGVEDLIKAAARLVQEMDDLHFVVVGDDGAEGRWIKHYRYLAEEVGLVDRFHFVGFRADVPDVMRDLDVFVMASWNEGFGLVVLEAMASGTVVVATAVGVVPELVENGRTGFMVAPHNPDDLGCAIRAALEMPRVRRDAMIRAAQARVAADFDVRKEVESLLQLYQTMLKKPDSPRVYL